MPGVGPTIGTAVTGRVRFVRLAANSATVRLGAVRPGVGCRTRRRIQRLLRVSRAARARTRRASHVAPVIQLATGTRSGHGSVDDSALATDDPSGKKVDGAVADVGRSPYACRSFANAGHKLQLVVCVRMSVRKDRVAGDGRVQRVIGAFVGIFGAVVSPMPTKEDYTEQHDRTEANDDADYVRRPLRVHR